MRATRTPQTNETTRRRGMVLAGLGLLTIGLVGCDDIASILSDAEKGWKKGWHDGSAAGGGGGGTGGTPACVSHTFDHDVLCDDLSAAKDQAYSDCTSHGLQLTDFGPATDCHAGDSRRLTYTCCPKSDVPPPPPPPPPPRDPKSCLGRSQGGSTSCKSVATWKTYAGEDCAAAGYELANMAFSADCAPDSYRFVIYDCCTLDGSPLPQPPPEPADPFSGSPVSGPARYAQYKCCQSQTACDVVQLGGEAVCKSADAWQSEATATCSSKGGTLYGLGLYQSCQP